MPILLVLSFICFVLASLGLPRKPWPPRLSILALGLALFVAFLLWPDAGAL